MGEGGGNSYSEKLSRESSTVKTRKPEQSIVSHEARWIQPWPRVQTQVDVIYLVCSTGAIVSNPH